MGEAKLQIETNFLALVPSFKFVREATFVIACDAVGVNWLRDRFLAVVNCDTQFVIGDGLVISSDDQCKLTVARAREASEIRQLSRSDFTWAISQEAAAEASDKLLSLATVGHPGHQYVDLFRGDYRSVVVTKDEYPIDSIRAMRDGRAPKIKVP